MNFPYNKVVRESFKMAFSSRKLWLFALFVSQGAGFVFLTQNDVVSLRGWLTSAAEGSNLWNVVSSAPTFLAYILGLGILIVLLSILSVIVKGSLIRGIAMVEARQPIVRKLLFSQGLHLFWRVLSIDILLSLPIVLGLSVWTFFAASPYVGVGSSIIIIVYSMMVGLFRHFSYAEAVLEKRNSWASVVGGAKLLFSFPKESIIVALMKWGFSVVSIVIIFIVGLLVAMPFLLLMFLSSLIFPWQVAMGVVVLGALLSLAVIFLVRSIVTQLIFGIALKTYWQLKK